MPWATALTTSLREIDWSPLTSPAGQAEAGLRSSATFTTVIRSVMVTSPEPRQSPGQTDGVRVRVGVLLT
jgi:hypothetical protein